MAFSLVFGSERHTQPDQILKNVGRPDRVLFEVLYLKIIGCKKRLNRNKENLSERFSLDSKLNQMNNLEARNCRRTETEGSGSAQPSIISFW